jgi:hypothetical protein
VTARIITDPDGRTSVPAVLRWFPGRGLSPVTGRQRLALAMGLRARGLRGLDVLRRTRVRAPPAGC